MSETAIAAPAAKTSSAAREALRSPVRTFYARTYAAGGALARAFKEADAQADLVKAYQATAAMILALEDLAKTAEAAAKDARAALMSSMQETGCPQIADDTMTVYLAREPTVLVIEEPERVPRDLWTQPAATPDRSKIKAALDQGRAVPGAAMMARNSQRLVIRTKKD